MEKTALNSKFYIVKLIRDDDFKLNKRVYHKGERFVVWTFDEKCYSIANLGGEYLMKENCEVINELRICNS